MACKNATDFNYELVDDECGFQNAISELKRKLEERNTLIAVDCEGDSLSRKGALTIITVATEEKVFIFDVLKVGRTIFSGGLGEILADKSREKLMFDCRQDSDALWHQFSVKLTGVLDLQLLEIIYRREKAPGKTLQFPRQKVRRDHRSQRTDEVENIYGFRRCIELYVQDKKLIKMKDKGSKLFKRDAKVWKKRPLSDELIQYCVVDTMGMFKLYNKLKDVNGGELPRLRVASEKYADLYRGKSKRSYDDYETNAFLQLDIIPDKGTLSFPLADTPCTGCDRRFPREEFTAMQPRTRDQKCRVCKEVKRRKDRQRNREAQWRRGERDVEDYHYEVFNFGDEDDYHYEVFNFGDEDDYHYEVFNFGDEDDYHYEVFNSGDVEDYNYEGFDFDW